MPREIERSRGKSSIIWYTTIRNREKLRICTYARVAGGNASAADSAFDGDGGGGGGGAAPSSNPCCGCCADGAASSPDADDTGRDDADADDRRAAKRSPSTGKRRGCDRLTCRVLLSSNQYRRSIKSHVVSPSKSVAQT